MLDFSFGELALIAMVGLLVVGPKDIPVVLRTIGRFMGHFRGVMDEVKAGFHQVMAESALHDLKEQLGEAENDMKYIRDLDGKLQPTYDISDFIPTKADLTALPKEDDKKLL